MSTATRVRVKQGDAEVEVEGSTADVERLLDAWWNRILDGPRKQSPRPESQRRPLRPEAPPEPQDRSEFDPVSAANRLKEHPRSDAFRAEVFHKRDLWPKIALVMYHVNMPLTSGEIAAVLKELDIKTNVASVSRKLDEQSSKVTRDGPRKSGSVPKYKLTSQARQEIESSLNK